MLDELLDYTVFDVFSDKAFGGCPVTVVNSAGALDLEQMQMMASEFATPRTAFVTGGAAGLSKVMFFSPLRQVPYSPLSALGAAVDICRRDESLSNRQTQAITISTATVDIKVKVSLRKQDASGKNGFFDDTFFVGAFLPRPIFASFGYNLALLSGALGTSQENIPSTWPLGLAFGGAWNLVVPMVTPQSLAEARPDLEAIYDLTKKLQCQSVVLYSHSGPNEIKCRTLSPALGIMGQSVSVTGAGSVCSLLVKESAVTEDSPSTLITARERMQDREPKLKVQVYGTGEEITAVQVTGMCVAALEGKSKVPG